MTIEQLDKSKVLISLCKEDMDKFSLDIRNMSFCDEHSRKVLLRLLQLACSKTGIEMQKGAVLLEALPHNCGCLLLVTVMEKTKRKTYKVKRYRDFPVYMFETAENLLSCVQKMGDNKVIPHWNSLWLKDDRYYLIFDYPLSGSVYSGILGEFGRRIKATDVYLSRLKESGKLLKDQNAVEHIYKFMM